VPVSIGVSFPESVMPGTPLPDIAGLAGLAEQVGLDGVWVGDRLAAGELSVLDSGLSLAVAAAATSSIAVGYAIFVPSLRPLAWAARQVATLQHIAGGRLQLGVAVGGGHDAEYLAAGFRRSDRARRTDEFLARLPGLLAGQPLPHGPGASGGDAIRLLPAAPVPPLWVGGPRPRGRDRRNPRPGGVPARPYAEAGADLIVVVCHPAPSPKSWELLADVRLLLTQ
jgi:alkanesulfonate monooxygenase SsuD/methylene tetrahydromethanopterin reductase-like flavin-dependent oxidoreductase (luciferase family)